MPVPEQDSSGAPPRWARWAAAGCGVVVLVLLVILGLGVFSADRMLAWSLQRLRTNVLAALPSDTPVAVRESLRARLDCVIRAVRDRRVSEQRIGEFSRLCVDAIGDRRVSGEELGPIVTMADSICREAGSR